MQPLEVNHSGYALVSMIKFKVFLLNFQLVDNSMFLLMVVLAHIPMLIYGVPQGSVVGLLLFNLYISLLQPGK